MSLSASAPNIRPAPPISRFFTTRDGLRLHYLDYPCPDATRLPVVCLPGLTRPADDFEAVAPALVAQGRRVLALDHRGRGRSEWDRDWKNYTLDVEQEDIFEMLALEGVDSAIFIGTSRGGLHVMRLALARPGLVRAAILNDIGPQIELDGLLRIKGYVGKLPPLHSFSDAAGLMRLSAGQHFSNVNLDEWDRYARLTFEERDGKIVLRFDPELSHTLDTVERGKAPDTMWEEFDALSGVPVMGIRGGNTDLLSVEIFDEMARRHPDFEQLTVEGHGHAPLLLDAPTIGRIAEFVARQK